MPLPRGYEIELLEGGVAGGSAAAEELLAFWAAHTTIDAEAARARLPHVVCLLRDGSGAVAASSSAVDSSVGQIGGRRFWVYRCLTPSTAARDAVEPMLLAVRRHLTGRVGADGVRPIGICFPVADPELIAERDEAVWPDSGMLFAGWTQNDEQLRISYFDGALIL